MRTAIGGRNRTGIVRAPDLAREMLSATEEFPPTSGGDAEAVARIRILYARDAEPVGTMPAPAGVGEAARRAVRAVAGGQPGAFLDKLGERLAFEATGTRLYDALVSKIDAGRNFRGGPSREDALHLRSEEHRHYLLVADAIRALGGDPTVVTPSANVQATASMGIPKVLTDPRTDVLQCLEALLVAELADNDCWPALVEMAESEGQAELAERFAQAVANEREHLTRVRSWVAIGHGRSPDRALLAGLEVERPPTRPAAAPTARRSAATRGRGKASARKSGRARKATARAKKAKPRGRRAAAGGRKRGG